MTPKLPEEVFKGIHFIRVSELPGEQQKLFAEWLPRDQFIKIMIEDHVVADCVQYHHYNHWFEQVYPKQIEALEVVEPKRETPSVGIQFLRPASTG